ncbi:dihydrofolate reductase [Naumannella halotolerans]|uniref:Dihydrofolate reductase n=1 Tax=Naumannella halotolerans TaxID=993414 RepID=A0A4R7J980_9ACTN|nr:dihydrofolate reductase [Naumannella halotolerans]TDT34072.1 dihydrofolate reductase [Naumannella halotolerans]
MPAAVPAVEDLTAIVIKGRGGVIGDGADQPFRISEDFQRFKSLTMGGVLIMGRKTHEAIGRPLPGRQTFVLTRDRDWSDDGVEVFADPDQALQCARARDRKVFICGGGEIYRLYWDRLTRLEVTEVDAEAPGDVTFPVIDVDRWFLSQVQPREGYEFQTWELLPERGTDRANNSS